MELHIHNTKTEKSPELNSSHDRSLSASFIDRNIERYCRWWRTSSVLRTARSSLVALWVASIKNLHTVKPRYKDIRHRYALEYKHLISKMHFFEVL